MPATPDTKVDRPLPTLQRFELLEEIGRGNTGTLYRTRVRTGIGGLRPGSEVAVKLLHPELIDHEPARNAFLREARAGMRVRHPNLVRIFAVEEVQRRNERLLYLVLELLDGRTVRQMLAEGLAAEPTLRTLGRQIAGALAALHGAGLLHLDVKPENLLWQQDRAVLLDLGFARVAAGAAAPVEAGRPVESSGGGSSDTAFTGTPAYAAPELLRGERPSPSTDLFALGVSLYESATGQRPFGDERRHGLIRARSSAVVRKPSTIQPRLSPFFDAVVQRLIAEDPADRFADAVELERVLSEGEEGAWWSKHGIVQPLMPVLHPGALAFTGRDAELLALEAAFAEARADDRPRIVILEGPAAVGKSRLAIEFAQRWRRRPSAPPFLYGRCLRLGRGSALRAVRDALARSLGLAPDQSPTVSVEHRLRAGLPRGAAEDLIALLYGRPVPRPRRRRAFLEWFRALGHEGPFLVFLDDLHAVHGTTIWSFLLEVYATKEVPALFMIAHRPELEADATAARRALLRRGRVSKLVLEPFDAAECDALLAHAFRPGGLPPGLAADLRTSSGGLPGVLHDLLRLLRKRGELHGAPGRLEAIREDIRVPLTRDHAEVLNAELDEMEAEALRLLQWASLFAPPLRVRLLAEMAGLSEARLARYLTELADEGWMMVEGGRYRFALPRLREAAYRSMDAAERRARHAHAFGVITTTQLELPAREAARAFHAHRGELHAEALLLGVPLLEKHISKSSWARAGRALESLEAHSAELPAAQLPAGVRCRLLVAKARLVGQADDHQAEAALLREAGEVARAAGDPSLKARVHLGLAHHARSLGVKDAALQHLELARSLGGTAAGAPIAPA
ncbi:MAG TPA: protein kinase [Planctomycetota bacterium]